MNLIDYKIYGNSVELKLPEGYQQVEYIESKGKQYIDTGVVPSSSTEFIIDCAYTKNDVSQMNGWGSAGSQEAFYCGVTSKGEICFNVSNNYIGKNSGVLAGNERHVISLKSGEQKIDNNVYAEGVIGNTATAEQTIYLFGLHAEWTSSLDSPCYMKLYSCKIYNGNKLIRYFIPCYRKSDNVIGLYDLANDVFYINNGTGTFDKGSEVNKIDGVESVGALVRDKNDINYGKYEISIIIKGKNLIRVNDYKDSVNWYYSQRNFNFPLIGNQTYTLSFDYTIENIKLGIEGIIMGVGIGCSQFPNIAGYNIDLVYKEAYPTQEKGSSGRLISKFTVPKSYDKCLLSIRPIRFDFNSSATISIKNFMLELEDVTEYRPYEEPMTTKIYINEPLRKIGDNVDYIDFEKQKVIRNVEAKEDGTLQALSNPIEEDLKLPIIPTFEEKNTMEVNSMIKPSNIDIKYIKN